MLVKLIGASWASRRDQRAAVDVLLAVEPLEIAIAERRIELRVGHVQVHLVGLVQAVGVHMRIDLSVIGRQRGGYGRVRCRGRRWRPEWQVDGHAASVLRVEVAAVIQVGERCDSKPCSGLLLCELLLAMFGALTILEG